MKSVGEGVVAFALASSIGGRQMALTNWKLKVTDIHCSASGAHVRWCER